MSETVKGNSQQNTPSANDLDARIEQDRQTQAAGLIPEVPKEQVSKIKKEYPKPVVEATEEVHDEPAEQDIEEVEEEQKEESKEEIEKEEVKDDDDYQKRIARLAYNEREARKKLRVLEEENARLRGLKPPETPSEENQRLIQQEAEKLYLQRRFVERSEEVYNNGLKQYKDWNATLGSFSAEGGLAPFVVEAILETDSPAKVTYYLGKNLDEYVRIRDLKPAAMGAALEKIATKINTPPPIRQQSKAPDPVKPITGSARATLNPEKMSTAEWIKMEDERTRNKRGRTRY